MCLYILVSVSSLQPVVLAIVGLMVTSVTDPQVLNEAPITQSARELEAHPNGTLKRVKIVWDHAVKNDAANILSLVARSAALGPAYETKVIDVLLDEHSRRRHELNVSRSPVEATLYGDDDSDNANEPCPSTRPRRSYV